MTEWRFAGAYILQFFLCQKESMREEKEKERERSEKEKEKDKQETVKEKDRHKGESSKERPTGKEAEADGWKDSDSFRRHGAAGQADKDHHATERTEKQRSSVTAEFDEATVDTSAVRDAEDTSKDMNEADVKEAKDLDKNRNDVAETEKGKRKVRDSDRDREDANEDAEDYEREVASS